MFGYWRFRDVALAILILGLALAFAVAGLGRQASLVFWATITPLVLFLILLEGVGRLGFVDWDALFGKRTANTESPGWALLPNTSVSGQTYQDIASMMQVPSDPIEFDFRTDRYGFRNSSDSEADIIILGDSVVLGALVPKAMTVDSIVSEALDLPVMQAALLGISVQEQQKMLLESGVPLKDKLVVQFLFEGNDLLDSAEFRQPAQPQSDEPPVRRQSSITRNIWLRLVQMSNPRKALNSCKIEGSDYLFLWTRKSFAGFEDEFSAITAAIVTFKERLADVGADYALIFVPTKYRVLHELCDFPEISVISSPSENLSDLPEIAASWAMDVGIPFWDVTQHLKDAAHSGNYPWFWGDTHWNAEGHKAAGISVADWLGNR